MATKQKTSGSEVVIEEEETSAPPAKKGKETAEKSPESNGDWKKVAIVVAFSAIGLWFLFRRKSDEKAGKPAVADAGKPAPANAPDRFAVIRSL